MFYCDACALANQWPTTMSGSHGPCERCDRVADCNDLPSSLLPVPVRVAVDPEEKP